jgi:porin
MKLSKTIKIFLIASIFITSTLVSAQDTLSGNWGGVRNQWSDNGVELELVYTAEYFKVKSGGIREDSDILDNVDLTATFDGEKLFGLKGSTFFLYILGNNGGSPSANTGDAQGVSNIDAPDSWKIYEAWYDQSFADDQASLRFGLYDLNSEFDVIESAGLFINPSFGIGPDYSQSGQNGPSIFPTTSLAMRIAYSFNENYYLQAAVLDGVPGDLNNDNGTHVEFNSGDGVLYAAEIGYTRGVDDAEQRYGKWALGVWHYSEDFDDLISEDEFGDPVKRDNNTGLYLLGEYNVYRENEESAQGAMVFARYGIANDDVNQIESYFGTGVVYTGLFPGRDDDQLGLAIAIANNGGKYKQQQLNDGNSVDDKETIIELSYRMQLLPWFAVQPDIQWIRNPGMDPTINNATVVGVRTEITF